VPISSRMQLPVQQRPVLHRWISEEDEVLVGRDQILSVGIDFQVRKRIGDRNPGPRQGQQNDEPSKFP
jgi:hypothetical protein